MLLRPRGASVVQQLRNTLLSGLDVKHLRMDHGDIYGPRPAELSEYFSPYIDSYST